MTARAQLVDWQLAVATAERLVRPGPPTSPGEAAATVADLRRYAVESREHVAEFTRMANQGSILTEPQVLIVDRPGWIRANAEGFRIVTEPLARKLNEKREGVPPSGLAALGPKATGLELGTLLAYLGHRILGQYEIFQEPGRLLLVAPNIVSVERELQVKPEDFRLWVCLHEETHRTQFAAVPWLRAHILGEIEAFIAGMDTDPGALAKRLREAGQKRRETGEKRPLTELVQTPQQLAVLDRMVAVMSLLEGHADVVMDGVGPRVVPSVADIRRKFGQRRAKGASRIDALVRRMIGMDAKIRQYRDGARFVNAVVEQAGMSGFNRVWTSPNTLPTRAEIADPGAWLTRVRP
ncbi:zinc-dependent metalloprotease [Catenulispora subtropica]|uniref:Zinc-dependent metalloprotease n=1 Tax=Catenulispora subtropica TaxID=450798 RepID=A0ABP5EL01_9ACTN